MQHKDETQAGELQEKLVAVNCVAKVVKGVSAAKAASTFNGGTKYALRIKLLV